MSIKMGILQLPSYKLYWSQELCCLRIANAIHRNRYKELLRNLHFVNNEKLINISAQDKLAEIRPLI